MDKPVAGLKRAKEPRYERILGINFYIGEAEQAIALLENTGGMVAVPAGPALVTLGSNAAYREALLSARLVIADSALMVHLWNLTHRPYIRKLSGLKYLRTLLQWPKFRLAGNALWVMPNETSAQRNLAWLKGQGLEVPDENIYIAPIYNDEAKDPKLVELIEARHPSHVVICLSGGIQEPLGHYLLQNLSYQPSVHCIGAAIGFLTGDQVHIPVWVDTFGLCWLWRIVSNPRRFLPRYWAARKLVGIYFRCGRELPPLVN